MGNIDKGVIMIAMGHDNYFRMGVNLAASIKRNSPDLHITIFTDRPRFENAHVFDSVEVLHEMSPVQLKTHIYTLSRYNKTLYLDVDMIILPGKDLNYLFANLHGVPFQIMNTCKGDDYSVWVAADVIRAETGNTTDPLPVYYSECIYFEKNEFADTYFKTVSEIYESSTVRGRSFAGGMADELAYILASMQLRFFPPLKDWLPVFWFFRDKKDTAMQTHKLSDKYYGYSLGGNNYPEYVKAQYNNLVAYYSQVMKVTKPFKALDKRLYLSNRSKI